MTRLDKNPLRILDSKDPRDRPIADSAPGDRRFPDRRGAPTSSPQVTAGLDAAGVAWTRNPRLVRGLDYYRHTAFEFVTDRLGAQGAVIAGGRYDGLIESLGGPHTPAVGWAAGIERLAMLIEAPAAARHRCRDRAAGATIARGSTALAALARSFVATGPRLRHGRSAARRGSAYDKAAQGPAPSVLRRSSAIDELARGQADGQDLGRRRRAATTVSVAGLDEGADGQQ